VASRSTLEDGLLLKDFLWWNATYRDKKEIQSDWL